MTPPQRPYFRPDDPLYGLMLMAEQDFTDFGEALVEMSSDSALEKLFEYMRSAMCQRVWFPPGTTHDYVRLCSAFTDLRIDFPSVKLAKDVFDAIQGRLRHYRFEATGDRWWIRLKDEPSFARPFDTETWFFRHQQGSQLLRLSRKEIPHVLGLFALLNGEHDWAAVERYAAEDESTQRALDLLLDAGCLVEAKPVEHDLRALPELLFLNHSTLVVRSESASVVFDPCVGHFAAQASDPRRDPFLILNHADAIFVTHNHWDHMPWATLMRIRRDVPFYVPKVRVPTYSNVPMKSYLEFLGFTSVTEIDAGETFRIGDMDVETYPFYGESFGLNSTFDAFTFLVNFGGRTLYASVDACHNEAGRMDPVMEAIAKKHRIDLLLFGSSDQRHVHPERAAGPRYLSNELLDRPELLRYHPNVTDVERWVDILSPRALIPYAQFIFGGKPRADLVVDPSSEATKAAFDDYWKGAGSDEAAHDTWRTQLACLRRVVAPPVVMLHPMQGARL